MSEPRALSTDLHTPGPWWVERRIGDALQVNARHRGEGSSYCVASINHWEGDADKANARLIAAAPELLAALKELAESCDAIPGCPVTTRARMAIHKAEEKL